MGRRDELSSQLSSCDEHNPQQAGAEEQQARWFWRGGYRIARKSSCRVGQLADMYGNVGQRVVYRVDVQHDVPD